MARSADQGSAQRAAVGPQWVVPPARRRPSSANSDRRRADGDRSPRSEQRERQQRELQPEAPGTGPLVVCLADPLIPELGRRRRTPWHDHVEEHPLPPPGRPHRAHQLEVLEECVARVPVRQGRTTDQQSPWPISRRGSVEEDPTRVPTGVPRARGEHVLRPSHVGVGEPSHCLLEQPAIPSHVVVGDHHHVVPSDLHASQHTAHLSHPRALDRREVAHRRWQLRSMGIEHPPLGTVDDDDVVHLVGEPTQGTR